ncbi:hypothetical protein RZO07_10145 [Pseudomonas protegens]|uniref:hypothetical protein n=1 Tax=Pseudomonas protegens TaxID=380021 RepID=UPI002936DD8B|nr:hypothetical protein [Pseudomonas protegens]WOE81562.1 hypothetical protein RZO07_10145 [Pseudomonas protegens]
MDRHKIETPEKSGMQAEQIHHQDKAALLCNASSIDTPVNNSICCAAAGITALRSSSTEALTPHQKLREAATPDATLIAQTRPPAQLVEGYTHPQYPPIASLRTQLAEPEAHYD